MFPGFLIGSVESQLHTLRRVGVLSIIVACVVALLMFGVYPRVKPADPGVIDVRLVTTTIGAGLQTGSKVVLHGTPVGTVTELSVSNAGETSIGLQIDKHIAGQLGQDFSIDYRPTNYFGITGLNISNVGDVSKGGSLRDGDRLWRSGGADYTMSTMIEQASYAATGSLQNDTMDAIRRTLAYSASLEPLIHTGIVVADTISQTQRRMPAQLISEYNDIFAAMPPFASGAIEAAWNMYDSGSRRYGDVLNEQFVITAKTIAGTFFSLVGSLLGDNEDNLTSATQNVRQLAGILPVIGQGALTPVTVRTLVDRLNGAFVPTDGGGRTLNLNVVLDKLPVLDGPLAIGGPRR